MKVAIAQYPVMSDVETQARPQAKATRPQEIPAATKQENTPLVANVCKIAVLLSGAAMIYGVVTYGRIFQNYLQW